MASVKIPDPVKNLAKPVFARADRTLRFIAGGLTILFGLTFDIYASAHLSNFLLGSPRKLPVDAVATTTGVLEHSLPWPPLAWVIFVPGLLGVWWLRRKALDAVTWWRGRSYGMDAMHDYFKKGDAGVSHWKSLWHYARGKSMPGMPLGRTIWGRNVSAPYDQLGIVVGGPGTGKTSSITIPAMLAAPGALYAVSHHPESIEVTRRPRDKVGRLWVFDPEGMVDDNPVFTWNPIAGVSSEGKAEGIAKLFTPRFRGTGEQREPELLEQSYVLLTALILAAGLEGQPLTKIVEWMPSDLAKPIDALRRHGQTHMLSRVEPILASRLAPRVISQTIGATACLSGKHVARYLAGSGSNSPDSRTVFNPDNFVKSTDTLYVLCSDGGMSAAPLVTLLTADVLKAADRAAKSPPHWKLERPFFAVFDSGGMIPMDGLHKHYIHAVGRGIGIMTCVHSYAEGKKAYGDSFDTMWANSGMRIYTGGSNESGFLDGLSKEVGQYTFGAANKALEARYETKKGKTIISPDELAHMPIDRALLLLRGKAPTLIRKISWRERRGADEIIRAMQTTTVKDMNDDEDDHLSALGTPLVWEEKRPVTSTLKKASKKATSLIKRG